uniref:Hic14 n=1 Tax=Sinohyriopsis cumingii TaxID=165450 RepID=A0A7G3FWH8_SINCU|nr:hic14 [Sinohyriopsis cumingii]
MGFSLLFGISCVFWLVDRGLGRDCTTQRCLTELYNSEVVYAEYYTRPLGSSGSGVSGWIRRRIHHAGVVVTLTNGERWLIHKGSGYGDASSTVITDANYMSSNWNLEKSGYVSGSRTVDDFLRAGEIDSSYNIFLSNCLTAANKMWRLVDD